MPETPDPLESWIIPEQEWALFPLEPVEPYPEADQSGAPHDPPA